MASYFPIALVVLGKGHKNLLYISAIYLIIYYLSGLSADIGERWIGSNLNVVGRRILTNQIALDFYSRNGMPLYQTLLSYAGERAGPVG